MSDALHPLGVIVGAIGVRGEVRVKTFTETPEALGQYGPLTDETGQQVFKVKGLRQAKAGAAVRLKGVDDRNAAEALKGTQLCVPREALGETEDEDTFFHVDLIGLEAQDEDGKAVGTVQAVHDFGAGELLDIRLEDGKSVLVPFTKEAVPVVDIKGGRLIAHLPEMNEDKDDEKKGEDA